MKRSTPTSPPPEARPTAPPATRRRAGVRRVRAGVTHPIVERCTAFLRALELDPTEPQRALFAHWTEGTEDLLLLAPTGSGKTFAASLPLLASIDADRASSLASGTAALVLAPTRALCEQLASAIAQTAQGFAALDRSAGLARAPLTVAARTGDSSTSARAALKKHPPAVLVLTPESLAVLLGSDARASLAGVAHVLLDEVHGLCAGKRGELLSVTLAILDELVTSSGHRRPRRVALSATAHPASQIARWIAGAEGPPATVIEAGTFRPPSFELCVAPADEPFPSPGFAARKLLPAVARVIARSDETTVVFVASRPRAEAWTRALRDVLPRSMQVACFHGSMSAEERSFVSSQLQRGELRAVVATSSLEAGVDLPSADQVLFLGAPATVTQALQGAGRSRHRPGEAPRAIVACTDVADILDAVAILRCASRGEIEPASLRALDEDVLVQGALALCALAPQSPASLLATLRRSWAFAALEDDALFAALDHLRTGGAVLSSYQGAHKINVDERGSLVLADASARRAYLRAVGTIVDDPAVEVFFGSRAIGRLEGRFAAGLEVADRFALAGSTWKVVARTPDRIDVARADRERGPIARWTGSRAPRSELVAREVARCYRSLDECAARFERDEAALSAAIVERLGVDRESARSLARWARAQRAVSAIATDQRAVLECVRGRSKDTLVLFTFAGWSANEAIARVAAERWRAATGAGCELCASDVGLALTLPRRSGLSVTDRARAWSLFAPGASGELRALLARTLDGSMLARTTFREVARIAQLSTVDRRVGAATPGLLYDVLRKHGPGHLLLSALERTLWSLLDGERAERTLRRQCEQELAFVVLDAPSPMSVPVLARAERTTDRVAPDDLDGALARAAHQLWLRAGSAELP
jgi:ATP-dependent Lhr-like helicase